jgi:hypothetical protein
VVAVFIAVLLFACGVWVWLARWDERAVPHRSQALIRRSVRR